MCDYLCTWREVADFRDPVEPGTPSWLELAALTTDFLPRLEDRATLCISSINRASFWIELEVELVSLVPVSVPSLSCSAREISARDW